MQTEINGVKVIGTPEEFKEFLSTAKKSDKIHIKKVGRPKGSRNKDRQKINRMEFLKYYNGHGTVATRKKFGLNNDRQVWDRVHNFRRKK